MVGMQCQVFEEALLRKVPGLRKSVHSLLNLEQDGIIVLKVRKINIREFLGSLKTRKL